MTTVGIRELKARLSAFIRRARAGHTVYVTDHGRVVAEIRPPASLGARASVVRRWQAAVAEGSITPAERPGDRSWLRGSSPGFPAGTAARLLDAERGEP